MSKVLIVVDMQNDFIDGALGTKEAEKIAGRVADKIAKHSGAVIFTRDTHSEAYLSTQEGHNLPVVHCIEGTHGWELQKDIGRLAEDKHSKVFDKNTFGSRELAEYLEELSSREAVEEIELVGLCTDICVISNALTIKAFLPETRIRVDASCCAGVTPESHRNALAAMKVCQIEILGL
ncbi:MAG TPA: isochorismatase family cysteine hydrolase [Clostridia bacterium]|nr:isochorismatase family cysteine hydrolase [Clostridia bacterium]